MKIDHLVVNVDPFIQEDRAFISSVQAAGLPYQPKWGKGTKGFKVSNIWIGSEYFELVRIKKPDGGGWVKDWTERYNNGHRGLVGLALDVEDIEASYRKISGKEISITPPEPLRFRWFFNLLQRTMPWRNAYLTALQGVPLQIFLQQMKDEKSRSFMNQYMVPNSRDNAINGIREVIIYGELTDDDKRLLRALFDNCEEQEDELTVRLQSQVIRFIKSAEHKTEVILQCDNQELADKTLQLHNIHIRNG
ncbi:hypothetical protein JFN88_24045 [Paenibacillus sp. MAHUQ-46]|uniref:Glyoxalase-like domain-containing protein n=1 Tax=Paenibacillus roseus TaxID=2798579 RepID=A0A934JA20_9BACL|nr:hypothetical protein [Paenibacillus roseus]